MSTHATPDADIEGGSPISETSRESSSEESFYFRRETTSPDRESTLHDIPANQSGAGNVRTHTPEGDEIGSNRPERTPNNPRDDNDTDTDSDSTPNFDQLGAPAFSGLVSEKTEYLMSTQEIQEWDDRIQETAGRLKKQQEDYENWENSLNKRRTNAYERLKRLKGLHTQRVNMYSAVTGYISGMKTLLDGGSSR